MGIAFLLDEMLSNAIAAELRVRGHDVTAVTENASLRSAPDETILAAAAASERALVTANIRDFVPLDQQYRATGRRHAGLVLIASSTFPQDRSFIGAVVNALDTLAGSDSLLPNDVVFLGR